MHDDPLGESSSGFAIYGDIAHELEGVTFTPLDPSLAGLGKRSDVFRVRLARPRTLQQDASQLVQRRYEGRGYQTRPAMIDPDLFTFAAYNSGELVGTVSVRFDSDHGLSADELYRAEVNELRTSGKTLCEFTRLALDFNALSKEVLGALFHTCHLYAHVVRGLTHSVIEVNPRHVAFYRRVLHFRPVGPERHNARVGAPAVMLALDFSVIDRELERFFAQTDWREKANSFFIHWFSPKDAPGVLGRLRALDDERLNTITAISSSLTTAADTPW